MNQSVGERKKASFLNKLRKNSSLEYVMMMLGIELGSVSYIKHSSQPHSCSTQEDLLLKLQGIAPVELPNALPPVGKAVYAFGGSQEELECVVTLNLGFDSLGI